MATKYKALIALFFSIVCWSSSVVATRFIVSDVAPLTINFVRLLIASIGFLPIFFLRKPWKSKSFPELLVASLFSAVNFFFFVFGIRYTSASASQLIYVILPILIIVVGGIFFKEKYSFERIIGAVIGLLGIIIVVYLSSVENGSTITGTLQGNLLIFIAMSGWLLYILFSKRLLKIFTPLEIASTAVITAFLMSVPLFFAELFFVKQQNISSENWQILLFIGFFGTFIPNILYQYGLKFVSSLTASFSSYLQPIMTTILEIILLGEQMTVGFLLGGILVFFGIFLSTTLEVYKVRKLS